MDHYQKWNAESRVQKQSRCNKERGFWVIISLMACLAVGLGAYIISTYVPESVSSTRHVTVPGETEQPVLSLQGPQSATITQGQLLHLHGQHFGINDTIMFLLDSTTLIKDENGQNISVRTSNSGSFTVSISTQGSDWSADQHYIQAVDNKTKQSAYINIALSPASTPEISSQNLVLSVQSKAVKKLLFDAVMGQGNPNRQRIILTNMSSLQMHWTATAIADHNLSWLVIDDNHFAGNLDINGTDSISISVLIAGLKINPPAHPYTGLIVFTMNGREQLILPVELRIANPQSEMIFSPNPGVAPLGAGNTCQPIPLTLINLSSFFINWSLVPYKSDTRAHIQFIVNGRTVTQGTLSPSGDPGDTQVLTLKCNSVSTGNTYEFTMYAGNSSWLVTIVI